MIMQIIQHLPGLFKRLSAIRYSVLWAALYLLSLPLSASATPSQASKGSLPIPGTTQTSEFLFLNQSGTILENDEVSLKWQSDGDLVVYFYEKEVLWSANTSGKGNSLGFQNSDGKLVIRNSSGSVIWSSSGTGGNLLKLQSDHNLVITNTAGQSIWTTSTTIDYLPIVTTVNRIDSEGEAAQDFLIPSNTTYKYIYLRTEGGDGGRRNVKEAWGTTRFIVKGGEGSTMIGTFAIGTGTNQIPPGSILRFIIGKHGNDRTGQTTAGCGGGGGTAILFKKPGLADWHLLMVSGGGGGAYSDCCTVKREGGPALTSESGDQGGGTNGGNGGTNGSYGRDGSGANNATGGGGAFEGTSTSYYWYSGGPGWFGCRSESNGAYTYNYAVLPTGGEGGLGGQNFTVSGAWGFGGGGSGDASGGGGGGYSGGGSGSDYHSGGGGGSYINTDYAVPGSVQKTKNGTTSSPDDGFVEYFLTNEAPGYKTIRGTGQVAFGQLMQSGNYHLYWQSDGNLVLYDKTSGSKATWACGAKGTDAKLYFQGDGNLVIYVNGSAKWSTQTADAQQDGNGGRYLVLRSDGQLLILNADGDTIWQAG